MLAADAVQSPQFDSNSRVRESRARGLCLRRATILKWQQRAIRLASSNQSGPAGARKICVSEHADANAPGVAALQPHKQAQPHGVGRRLCSA